MNGFYDDTTPVFLVHMELNKKRVTNGIPGPFVTCLTG